MSANLSPVASDVDSPDKAASHAAWARAKITRAMADSRPRIPHDEAMNRISAIIDEAEQKDALAKATGRTKTFYAREAILAHLDDLEDRYMAEHELAAIRAGESELVPLEEVMKRYGMAT